MVIAEELEGGNPDEWEARRRYALQTILSGRDPAQGIMDSSGELGHDSMRYVLILAVWGLLTVDYWMLVRSPANRPELLWAMTWWKWMLLPLLAVSALAAETGFARQFLMAWWWVLGGLGILWWWLS